MNAKYKKVKKDIIDFMHNKIIIKEKRDIIIDLVMLRFPAYIGFFKVDNEMIKEMLEWIHDGMYREIHRKHYDNQKL